MHVGRHVAVHGHGKMKTRETGDSVRSKSHPLVYYSSCLLVHAPFLKRDFTPAGYHSVASLLARQDYFLVVFPGSGLPWRRPLPIVSGNTTLQVKTMDPKDGDPPLSTVFLGPVSVRFVG